MEEIKILEGCHGFQWDAANANKNWINHQVSCSACEEVFFNEPILLYEDTKHSEHSEHEARYYVLGKTNDDRKLFIVFTMRKELIRVISARDMNKKERQIYECT